MRPKWLRPTSTLFEMLGEPAVIIAMVAIALWIVFGGST